MRYQLEFSKSDILEFIKLKKNIKWDNISIGLSLICIIATIILPKYIIPLLILPILSLGDLLLRRNSTRLIDIAEKSIHSNAEQYKEYINLL
jgi:hypothetical protein